MTKIYHATDLGSGLYGIQEKHLSMSVMMYLVVGREKAALVDSGFGVTDTLRGFVETLTDKPVICIVAHGHPDHAGAAALFDEIYMSEKDEPLLPVSLSYGRRMDDVFGCGGYDPALKAYCETHIVMPEKLDYIPIGDGDVFDLGGKRLEIISIPGHTPGSVAVLNRAENYALTSDCFSARTALIKAPPEKGLGVTRYRDGLARLLERIDDGTRLYWGHGTEALPHEIPADMLRACNEVLEGKTGDDLPSNNKFNRRPDAQDMKMMEHICGSVMLVYDANKL